VTKHLITFDRVLQTGSQGDLVIRVAATCRGPGDGRQHFHLTIRPYGTKSLPTKKNGPKISQKFSPVPAHQRLAKHTGFRVPPAKNFKNFIAGWLMECYKFINPLNDPPV
jgi:hypothetical protein